MSSYNSFFKAYDMRGTYPQLNENVYYWFGRALVEVTFKDTAEPQILLARDGRYTSEAFYKALVNGILDAGGKPICLGVGSSDFLYAACQSKNLPGGSLTASHNPKDDNGLKVVLEGSSMLGLKNGLDKVRDYVISKIDAIEIDKSTWVEAVTDEQTKAEITQFFMGKIKEIGDIDNVNKILTNQNKKLKIAVDAGNGTGGFVMELAKDLYQNIEFVPMYWELDGNFPNHPADPQTFANLKDLQDKVKNNDDIDFGFAFDGDADRVFFVDDKAEIVQGDFLVAFFAQTLLKKYKANPNPDLEPAIVYLQPGSRCVPEAIAQNDGIAIPSEQGHTGIKARMEKYRAIYGGENSGHHYFSEFGRMDSGILAAVLMIKLLAENGKKLSEIFKTLNETYFISDLIAIKLKEDQTFEAMKAKLIEGYPDATFSEFDGLSVFYPDWKFVIRPSNTEPVLKMFVESRGTDQVKARTSEIYGILGL